MIPEVVCRSRNEVVTAVNRRSNLGLLWDGRWIGPWTASQGFGLDTIPCHSWPGLFTMTYKVRRATNQGLTDGAQWLAWDSLGPFLDLGPPATTSDTLRSSETREVSCYERIGEETMR